MPKGKKSKRRATAKFPSPQTLARRADHTIIFLRRVEIIARQLDTAIYLWFHETEIVSTHVLAAVVHRNLRELGEKSGKGPMLGKHIREEKLYLTFDSFRHGDCDVDFAPWNTQALLLDAIISFHKLYGFRTSYMSTLGSYLSLNTTLFSEGPNEPFYEGLLIKDVRDISAQAFFARMVPLFARSAPTIRLGVSDHPRYVGLHLP